MEGRDVRFLAIHPFNRREECENKGSVLSSAAKRIWSGNTVGKERKRKREFGSDGIRGRIFLPPIRRMKYEEFGIKQPHKTRIILNVFFFFLLGRKFSEFILRANLSPSDAERRYRFQPSPFFALPLAFFPFHTDGISPRSRMTMGRRDEFINFSTLRFEDFNKITKIRGFLTNLH